GLLGPGLITGASDDDPSGIGTYSVAGARFGYSMLWAALVTFPLMTAVQLVCARIALATGKGIGTALADHYPRRLVLAVLLALFVANTINVGADIMAIAAGVNLLVPISIGVLIVPIGLLILALQIWGSYRQIARVFKWLTLSLFGYIAASLLAKPDWKAVAWATFVPTIRFDAAFLSTLVAILGTTISPYLFFWQASQEVEEQVARGRRWVWQRRAAADREIQNAFWDVGVGMFFSNLVMYFIIFATAATLHKAGQTEIGSAEEAAAALAPLAGRGATVLMALALVGSGLLAVPVLSGSAAYAICEAMHWPCTLDAKPGQARGFYLVIAASTLGGLAINFFGVNPIDALFWTAVINGFLAPPLLAIIMLVASNKQIMGKQVSGRGLRVLGWATTLSMFAAAIGLLATWGAS
ncbi:MAG TPA: divalent metal cation transporter, partial [Pirellulales bacterium]|nr:divalent metal cation transporter [Pirellulales bacterium]